MNLIQILRVSPVDMGVARQKWKLGIFLLKLKKITKKGTQDSEIYEEFTLKINEVYNIV